MKQSIFKFIFKRGLAIALLAAFAFQVCGCSLFGKESDKTSDPYHPDVDIATPDGANPNQTASVTRNGYSISTSSEYATMVGVSILESGGNAVDAAIAVAYTLGVVEAYGSGIGGGGGMIIYDSEADEYKCLNYLSEAAPSGATHLSIGVPGFVDGMQTAYDLYGTMKFEELLQPAIDYAENGFVVDADFLMRIRNAIGTFSTPNTPYAGISNVGDTIVQADTAALLRTIATEGSEAFYTGSIAQKIIAATHLTADDLASYDTIVSDAVVGEFHGNEIASVPAPFSGTTLIQMLKMAEILNIPNPTTDPKGYLDTLVKLSMTCGKDRVSHICDTRFASVEFDFTKAVSDEYIYNLLDLDYSDFEPEYEGQDTTHFSIIDKNGMAVSCTNTLTQFFGSKLYIDGFFINNSMRNFTSGNNKLKPGKRCRTFMSPTLIRNDAGDILAIGTPGGSIIPGVMVPIILDIYLFDVNPQEAVNKQRVVVRNAQSLLVENGYDGVYAPVVNTSGSGYLIVRMGLDAYFGSVNIAAFNNEVGYFATADIRRYGCGRAYN
ncbi:MAG: gamma-glutamyltransferase [Christensenellaceae bacterium]|nr:gamma-glutamyltransferase [Christensenellaceae bacterium]